MGFYGTLTKKIEGISKAARKKSVVAVPKLTDTAHLLEGKVALITGGSGGIGFAIAKAFVESGCKVVITGTNQSKLDDCVEKLGNNCKGIVVNLTDTTMLGGKVQEAAECFDGRIDILVNAAGITNHTDFRHMTEKEYDDIMDINAKGTFFMCQFVSELMIKQKIKGHILNVTSSSALRPAWTPYQMSKWAIRGFTIGLADTLIPYGIVVNAIAPGPVATPMLNRDDSDLYMENHPCKRMASASEIANLAVFMVSDMGDLIVGDTFYITGGSGLISNRDI